MSVVCCVVCVSILTPCPCIYRREPPAIRTRNEPNRHWGSTTPRHVSSERRWGPWAVALGRPTWLVGRLWAVSVRPGLWSEYC